MAPASRVAPGLRPMQSISIQLTAFALVISMIPLFLISGALIVRLQQVAERELTQSYEWLAEEHVRNAEKKIAEYRSGLRLAAQSTAIIQALLNKTENPFLLGRSISAELFRIIPVERHMEIHNCILYAQGFSNMYAAHVTVLTDAVQRRWERDGYAAGDAFFMSRTWNGHPLLSLMAPITSVSLRDYTATSLGMLKLDLRLDLLFAPAAYRTGEGGQSYQLLLTDGQGQVRYCSERELQLDVSAWPGDEAEQFLQSPDGASYLVLKKSIPDYGLSLFYLFRNDALVEQKKALYYGYGLLLLALLAMIFLVVRSYFRRLSQRLGLLLRKFSQAAEGDLRPKPPIPGRDEITLLDTGFEHMIRRMNAMNRQMAQMNRQSYEQKLALHNAQYRNLQLQINPHFLYNTLETIGAIGEMHQAPQISELCGKLGDIFRYSLSQRYDTLAPLACELQQLENYIYIQQVRYQFQASFVITVDPQTVYVPKFMLQPIAENAVLHGLRQKAQPGTLSVVASRAGEGLAISISDDGAGMDEAQLTHLRRELQREDAAPATDSGLGIGILNIQRRIRLAYGAGYGILVESRPGEGSTFTLHLPWLTQGDAAPRKEAEP